MLDWYITFCLPELTKPFCFAYRQPAIRLLEGGLVGLAGQFAVVLWQVTDAVPHVRAELSCAWRAAANAADWAAVLQASSRQ